MKNANIGIIKLFSSNGVEEGCHECDNLQTENEIRKKDGELNIFVFKDLNSQKWDIRVGLEFISVKFCPFCGKRVEE